MASKLLVNELQAATGSEITIAVGTSLTGGTNVFKITGGLAGQSLITDGAGNISFGAAIPSVTGQSGKFLTTDGTVTSWDTVDALPSQTGQAGEFLTTDGTTATWEAVVTDPTMGGDLTGTASNAQLAADAVGSNEIAAGAVGASEIASTFDISSKTVTLPAASVTAHVTQTDTSVIEYNIALLAFKVASSNSLAKFQMVDQVVDEFVDATGIDASASTNEVLTSGYYGGGETVTVSGNYDSSGVDGDYTWYKWTTVTSAGSYTTDTAQDYEYLVIAGGGGGGGHGGSGGGAGGYRTATGFAIGATTISGITVGAGGAGGGNANGTKGNNSVFSSITSTGGGLGAGGGNNANNGGAGGSGGGGRSSTQPAGNEGSYSPVEGYDGGTGITGSNNWPMGGGGGASEAGNNGTSDSTGGDGGDGRSSSIDGTATTRAGGGGGSDQGNPGGVGGAGGGGNAGNGLHVTDGTANTGSGGGGQHAGAGSGGTGGSGIVIIRRPTGGIDDLSLVSTTTTAEATPTTGDLVILIEDQAGTATINTDVLGYISRNAGSNWSSAVTFVDEGDWGTNKRILVARDVDISSLTGTTSMRYKIATANQSAAKETRIHAVSLAWS